MRSQKSAEGEPCGVFCTSSEGELTLTCFKARILFIDNVNAAFTLNHLAVFIAGFSRFQ